jgi:hypothetical protein
MLRVRPTPQQKQTHPYQTVTHSNLDRPHGHSSRRCRSTRAAQPNDRIMHPRGPVGVVWYGFVSGWFGARPEPARNTPQLNPDLISDNLKLQHTRDARVYPCSRETPERGNRMEIKDIASGSEIGFSGRLSAGWYGGKPHNRVPQIYRLRERPTPQQKQNHPYQRESNSKP